MIMDCLLARLRIIPGIPFRDRNTMEAYHINSVERILILVGEIVAVIVDAVYLYRRVAVLIVSDVEETRRPCYA